MRKFFMFLLIPLYLFSISDKDKKAKKSPCAERCKNCLHEAVLQYGTNEHFRQPLTELIKAGSVNVQNKKGQTPLHIAVKKHYLGVARFLVHNCGAELRIEDKKKRRPLDIINAQIEEEKKKKCKSSLHLLVCFQKLLTPRTKTI